MDAKTCNESRVVRTGRIFPNDVNNHNTLFGGKLMSDMDMIASISAVRHARKEVVTASTDSVDFLSPITQQDSICIESFVTFTGTSSMEVFVKVIAENLITGNRKIAATAFLTFVALDENGKPTKVPGIVPESEEEKSCLKQARIEPKNGKNIGKTVKNLRVTLQLKNLGNKDRRLASLSLFFYHGITIPRHYSIFFVKLNRDINDAFFCHDLLL